MARLTGEHLCHLSETFDYDFYIEVVEGGFEIKLLYGATSEEHGWLIDNGWESIDWSNMTYRKY